jgi:4-hydroxythreonine-4-phosphate dehydrogenase
MPGTADRSACEEIELIAPAVQRCRRQGMDARGPYSPDTVFIAARRGDFDAVVSMYHDQGQIAMKLMGFERGVTLHGGLPVPVATSASGSAYDIAGRRASPSRGPAGRVRPVRAHGAR